MYGIFMRENLGDPSAGINVICHEDGTTGGHDDDLFG